MSILAWMPGLAGAGVKEGLLPGTCSGVAPLITSIGGALAEPSRLGRIRPRLDTAQSITRLDSVKWTVLN